jgi:hypothetical protein
MPQDCRDDDIARECGAKKSNQAMAQYDNQICWRWTGADIPNHMRNREDNPRAGRRNRRAGNLVSAGLIGSLGNDEGGGRAVADNRRATILGANFLPKLIRLVGRLRVVATSRTTWPLCVWIRVALPTTRASASRFRLSAICMAIPRTQGREAKWLIMAIGTNAATYGPAASKRERHDRQNNKRSRRPV